MHLEEVPDGCAVFTICQVFKPDFPAPLTCPFPTFHDMKNHFVIWKLDSLADMIEYENDEAIIDLVNTTDEEAKEWKPISAKWKLVNVLNEVKFECPHCKKQFTHNKQISNVTNHLKICKEFINKSGGQQADLNSIIVSSDMKQEARRRISMLPYLTGYPELILRNPFFKWMFLPLQVTVPCIQTSVNLIKKELEATMIELAPPNVGFYSFGIDGWSKYICTQPYAAMYIYHVDNQFKFTKMLYEFEGLKAKLDAAKLLEIYRKYSTLPFGQLVGFTVDHAQENISAMQSLGENVLGFGCLFHKLQLLIEHCAQKHKVVISWVMQYTAQFHGSYDCLIEIISSTDAAPSKFGESRWCSIVEVIRYFLRYIHEVNAFLHGRGTALLNSDDVSELKEILSLLEPIETIVNLLLQIGYIPIAYYYPILVTLKDHLETIPIIKIIETKASLIKE